MAIKRRASFSPKAFLAKVGEGRNIGAYRSDQIVFSQRDPADLVFYIQKGKVKLTVVSKQGKEAVVAILGTNEFFGEGCLTSQVQRIATVTTMTESRHRAAGKSRHRPRAPSGTSILRDVHCASSGPNPSRRSGSR